MAKNILATRLRAGDARRAGNRAAAKRQRLSGICADRERPRALFPVIVGLRQWGKIICSPREKRTPTLVESDSGRPVPRLTPIGSAGRRSPPLNTRVVKVEER